MTAPTGKLHAWIVLTRCSNLPTVWANVLHGMTAAMFVGVLTVLGPDDAAVGVPGLGFLLDQAFMLLLGMSLIYTAGMVLNDVCDARQDAQHRPTRPIPSGRVSRRAAGVVGTALLVAGVAATSVYACAGVWVLSSVLALCVVAYNLLHRVKLLGYFLMPVCRALVLLIAATAYPVGVDSDPWWRHVAMPAIVIAVYTAVITLTAWSEHLVGRERLRVAVPLMIAAMPLIDAGFLAAIGQWGPAGFCVGCAALTAVLQRFVPGT